MTASTRNRPVLANVLVDVWVRRVADVRDGRDLLDDHESATLARIVTPTTAMAYAAEHVLARRAVASVVGSPASALRFDRTCTRCGAPHGRPRLLGFRGIELSLARCDDWVAVALSSTLPVGVDIESIESVRFDGFPDVALHPEDRGDAEAGEVRDVLLRRRAVSWVRKEAALKAVGTGLRTDPAGLRTPPSGIPTDLLRDAAAQVTRTATGSGVDTGTGTGTGRVTVHDLTLPWREAAAAVAVSGPASRVDVRLR